jgi:hypothetical protein
VTPEAQKSQAKLALEHLARLNTARAEIGERMTKILLAIKESGVDQAPDDLFDLLDQCTDKLEAINQTIAEGEALLGISRGTRTNIN